MRSRILLDYVDSGSGMEPVIRICLNPSEDPKDKMIKQLIQNSTHLEVRHGHSETEYNEDGQPQFKSMVYLQKPKN